jgi:O-antigen/teichoic acid export membrane protein
MSIRDKIVTNTTYLTLNWIAITILPIAFWFMVGKMLPPESYGIVYTGLQLAIFLSLVASFGFPMVLDKLISELDEKKQYDKIQGLINYTFKITIGLVVLISAAVLLFAPQISGYMKLDTSVLWIVVALFVVNTTGNYFKNVYFGFQNMKKIFLTNLFGQTARIFVTLVLVYMGFVYFGAFAGLFVSFFIILVTRLDRKTFTLSKTAVVDKPLIYRYALPSLAYLILAQLYGNTQNIMLTSLTTAAISGVFGMAVTMTSLISTIPQIVSSAIFPVLSGLCNEKHAKQRQAYLLRIVLRYSLATVLPIAAAIMIFANYAILLVSRPDYLPASQFLLLLIPAEVLNAVATLFLSSLYAVGEPSRRMYAWGLIVLVYVPAAILMTQAYSAMGLAIAYTVSAVLLLFASYYFIKKTLDMKIDFADIRRILLAIAVFSAILLASQPLVSRLSAYGILAQCILIGVICAASSLVYAAVLIATGFLIEEDMHVLDTVAGKLPVFKGTMNFLRSALEKHATRTYRQ